MSELTEARLAFREAEREFRERNRHLDVLYAGILVGAMPENGDTGDDGESLADIEVVDGDLDVVEILSVSSGHSDSTLIYDWDADSISSWHSDSGFGGSNSNLSSISEFSSVTAELRYNEGCHFGYIVAPEHYAPDVRIESMDQTNELDVNHWLQKLKTYTTDILNEIDDYKEDYGQTSVETDVDIPIRRGYSETSITRSKKRKRDDQCCVMKSSSDHCIASSFKKRRMI